MSGSFEALCFHMRAIEKVLVPRRIFPDKTDLHQDLLGAWLSLKLLERWQRIPFAIGDFSEDMGDIAGAETLTSLFDSNKYRTEAILSLLIDARRFSTMILLHPFFDHECDGSRASLSNQCLEHYYRVMNVAEPIPWWRSEARQANEPFRQRLVQIKDDLKQWHAHLHPSDIALEQADQAYGQLAIASFGGHETITLYPLAFESRRAAMNYLLYALANLLCDVDLLDFLTSDTYPCSANGYQSSWLTLILRILSGLHGSNYLPKNDVGVSMVEVLFECVCRNVRPEVDSWLMEWLQENEAPREGACSAISGEFEFELKQMELIARRRKTGKHVLCSFTYGGGAYDSEKEAVECLIYGRDAHSRHLYYERVDLRASLTR
ncbi:hypothetical protein ANO11243_049960 [Dothideomycetidae sp. 11243]|nr:hypothetical protein ANO11243_049960 [fungal sp. No.11243]